MEKHDFRENLRICGFTIGNAHFQEIENGKTAKKRTKTDEKSSVCWRLDFGSILGGFGEGFGRPKSLIFAYFSMFFRSIFRTAFWKAKKSKKKASAGGPPEILGRPGGMCGARGRDREGVNPEI